MRKRRVKSPSESVPVSSSLEPVRRVGRERLGGHGVEAPQPDVDVVEVDEHGGAQAAARVRPVGRGHARGGHPSIFPAARAQSYRDAHSAASVSSRSAPTNASSAVSGPRPAAFPRARSRPRSGRRDQGRTRSRRAGAPRASRRASIASSNHVDSSSRCDARTFDTPTRVPARAPDRLSAAAAGVPSSPVASRRRTSGSSRTPARDRLGALDGEPDGHRVAVHHLPCQRGDRRDTGGRARPLRLEEHVVAVGRQVQVGERVLHGRAR